MIEGEGAVEVSVLAGKRKSTGNEVGLSKTGLRRRMRMISCFPSNWLENVYKMGSDLKRANLFVGF